MGGAWGVTPAGSDHLVGMPAGAYGDSIGGMALAGGIAAALFGRERTGEPSIVDVSLMGVGAWAFGLSLGNAAMTGESQPPPVLDGTLNPTVNSFKTSDGRWINFTMTQPFRYFADVCRHLDLEHLIDDERFSTFESLMAHTLDASRYFTEAFAARPYAYWVERLQTLEGPWAPVQEPVDMLADPQMEANGYLLEVADQEGNARKLVANPVQFDERPPAITRGPQFAEHTDELLGELGRSEDDILKLKIEGAAT